MEDLQMHMTHIRHQMSTRTENIEVYAETFSRTFDNWNLRFTGFDIPKDRDNNLYMKDHTGKLMEIGWKTTKSNDDSSLNQLVGKRQRKEFQPELYVLNDLVQRLSNACVTLTKDYWNYEWCFGKRVNQFHLEQKNNVITKAPDWSLGQFVKRIPVYRALSEEERKQKKDARILELIEYFEDGQFCDETGKGRKTEVHIQCCEGKKNSFIHRKEFLSDII
jgi:hypothetical protein